MITAVQSAKRAIPAADVVSQDEIPVIEAFESDLGWMAIAWRQDALLGIAFGHASRRSAEIAVSRSLRLTRPHEHATSRNPSPHWPNWVKELVDGFIRGAGGGKPEAFNIVFAEVEKEDWAVGYDMMSEKYPDK